MTTTQAHTHSIRAHGSGARPRAVTADSLSPEARQKSPSLATLLCLKLIAGENTRVQPISLAVYPVVLVLNQCDLHNPAHDTAAQSYNSPSWNHVTTLLFQAIIYTYAGPCITCSHNYFYSDHPYLTQRFIQLISPLELHC